MAAFLLDKDLIGTIDHDVGRCRVTHERLKRFVTNHLVDHLTF